MTFISTAQPVLPVHEPLHLFQVLRHIQIVGVGHIGEVFVPELRLQLLGERDVAADFLPRVFQVKLITRVAALDLDRNQDQRCPINLLRVVPSVQRSIPIAR